MYFSLEQTAEVLPSVQVWSNGILASCARDPSSTNVTTPGCYFTYSSSLTPRVTKVEPLTGLGGGDVITISGNGFDAWASGNTVTIGGQACIITSSSASQLMCAVADTPAGLYNLTVLVSTNGSGYAVIDATQQELLFEVRVSSVSFGGVSACGGYVVSLLGTGFFASGSATTNEVRE